ncbi:MAG TPA: sugar phosphate isomerase/epimerase family protein [Chthonomonadales bacterium]|nr:sugar phosphate isomerase/epimerase family protein [Chthonomonadales bacterium]
MEQPFVYCLNTSTIRGSALPISRVVEIAASAGFTALEPWIDELDRHVAEGGSLRDLGRKICDLGLSVESAVGFFEWIVDDEERREAGYQEARRNMQMLAELGGKRLAAPAFGAQEAAPIPLQGAAQRYGTLLEMGRHYGVTPMVEVWGFSTNLRLLGEAMYVALESGRPGACVLPDTYHLYKGGSGYEGIKLLNASAIGIFHVNDYPASPGRDRVTDADRVYPGDGVAPLTQVFRDLRSIGYHSALSVELFNEEYWRSDPAEVAATALRKTRDAVAGSL